MRRIDPEILKMLEESQRKQRIAIRIMLAAAMGSVICTVALIIYEVSCL